MFVCQCCYRDANDDSKEKECGDADDGESLSGFLTVDSFLKLFHPSIPTEGVHGIHSSLVLHSCVLVRARDGVLWRFRGKS